MSYVNGWESVSPTKSAMLRGQLQLSYNYQKIGNVIGWIDDKRQYQDQTKTRSHTVESSPYTITLVRQPSSLN